MVSGMFQIKLDGPMAGQMQVEANADATTDGAPRAVRVRVNSPESGTEELHEILVPASRGQWLSENIGYEPTAAEVAQLADGAPVATGGIVVTRQRPGSAGGVIFVTLEDETGYVNLVVWSRIADAHRRAMLGARLLGVRGRMQREGAVRHVVVDALEDRSALLGSLTARARNFR